VFERFTDQGRAVMVLAQEEARTLAHNFIGTEHILLGLSRQPTSVAAKALVSLGVSRDDVRQQVVRIIGEGERAPSGHIPFTPRAKKVLELSLRESLHLGHNCIGTEHLLLGLIREGEGVAVQALINLGANPDRVREVVLDLSAAGSADEPHPTAAAGARRPDIYHSWRPPGRLSHWLRPPSRWLRVGTAAVSVPEALRRQGRQLDRIESRLGDIAGRLERIERRARGEDDPGSAHTD
jgi:ATP-dependent Clp protease ATP-binding subunit ClpA